MIELNYRNNGMICTKDMSIISEYPNDSLLLVDGSSVGLLVLSVMSATVTTNKAN